MLIIEKGLAQIEKNTLFTDYYTKWFFFDLVNSGKYKELSDNSLFDISLHIVKSAVHVGNHYVERDMIEKLNVYSTSADKRIICLDRLLQYQIRNNTSLIENTINEINALLDTIIDDEKRVSYLLKIAVAYFYLGKNKIGLESMKKIMNDYFDIIQASQQLKTEYSHNLGLFAHDLDKNMSVIENAQTSIEGYKKSGDEYSLLISKINLYDGYMGYGDLVKANNVIFDLDSKISSKTSLQVQDIHYICKANFLLTAGKVMTALYYYEKGITIASQISHKWDETYGKIWRELALSYYGEKNAFDNLKAIFFQLDEDNRFLKSLAGAFYYLSGYILKVDKFDDESLIAKYVTSSEFNGHIVIMQMVIDLLGIKSDISIKPELIVRHMIDCEGIKGGFTIVNDFLNAHEELDYLTESWAKKHLYGINNYRQTEKTRLLQNLDDSFCVKSFNCSTCQAMCCYDGVYVSAKEEKRIKRFVIEHKEFFQDLPETLFEYSNWMGVVEGRKTKTKDFHYSNPEYPKHFNDTRCVFALDNGACSLQVVATKLGLHPWSVKPQSCWLFPLDVDENGDVLPPPANKEKDPNYIKGVYEGYVSALPCGQCNSTGADWRETYINEIEYFYFRKELMNK